MNKGSPVSLSEQRSGQRNQLFMRRLCAVLMLKLKRLHPNSSDSFVIGIPFQNVFLKWGKPFVGGSPLCFPNWSDILLSVPMPVHSDTASPGLLYKVAHVPSP